jgi:RNA polymerase sigma-70 factor (ECF subfamily)
VSTPVENSALLDVLLARREAFLGFLAARLNNNRADAEDVLQHGFSKALASTDTLRGNDRIVPWFYQLLRHVLIDHLRARHAATEREQRWTAESISFSETDHAETERRLCACLEPLIATLPSVQAELIRRCELADQPVSEVATALGMTPNAASVALHRARKTLRTKLMAFCGPCASSACLNCDCTPQSSPHE